MSEATFETFVKDQKIHLPNPWMGPLSSWFNQLEWIRDEDGNIACDCLRLEHIEEDISAYFGRQISIPSLNKTEERYDYRLMYTDELIDVVAEIFRDDIEYFGFSFEGAATKNVGLLPQS